MYNNEQKIILQTGKNGYKHIQFKKRVAFYNKIEHNKKMNTQMDPYVKCAHNPHSN